MARVLFICLHNAGRSQMSAALFEQAAEGRHTASSAGTTPAERVHPEVVEVMREIGVDLSDRVPRGLTWAFVRSSDDTGIAPDHQARHHFHLPWVGQLHPERTVG